ncbi:DUF5683 domain-containing protein [Parabacteroides bouchesdurhonensis]|uniref:DUF5683 domain-containing protein n=1 Tax=Parabacteroides bouchesdurhonensis TaxID=1936995 RepID=UPI000E54D0C9|nr:DUF5683 domain-containing protein [Parabacteroides bouchesdurhonensis]RHJ90873.1 hypothetical protein DW095_12035 [Bacteroides sp. AM07-16]
MKHIIIFFLIFLIGYPYTIQAQEVETAMSDTLKMSSDQMSVAIPDSSIAAVLKSADSAAIPAVTKMKAEFKPNPTTATLLALVPGLGQIYNRKYWKLPIVYGGFMGCLYAITWNNKNYQDYSTAYQDIMIDYNNGNPLPEDEWHNSWKEILPNGRDYAEYLRNTQFHNQLKSRKDYYRRYRDLSIIITVGIYALSIVDAYIDAQLFDFDISPDLSMHLEPTVTPRTNYSSRTYGINCSLTF